MWIGRFAAGIGTDRAVVIVEPDALASIDCLPARKRTARLALLRYAVTTLAELRRTYTYLDAGNSNWQSAATMARRLRAVGDALATGFSLNVSNFLPTAAEEAYGDSISTRIGGKH
jgi:endoglucanase